MNRFEVQCGTLRTIVQAESSRQAALWAVHQAMQQVLPTEDVGESAEAKSERLGRNGFAVLSGEVRVTPRGGGEATTLPTLEVVNQWNEMVTTLDRLERMLHRAA